MIARLLERQPQPLAASACRSARRPADRASRSASSGSTAHGDSSAAHELELDAARRREVVQRRRQRLEQLGKVGPAASLLGRRMDLRREIEIVDRAEQQPRLADDVARALAISAVGGAEKLAVDDLGKADDRVQRRLDLVDQLAQRIRGRSGLRGDASAAPTAAAGRAARSRDILRSARRPARMPARR